MLYFCYGKCCPKTQQLYKTLASSSVPEVRNLGAVWLCDAGSESLFCSLTVGKGSRCLKGQLGLRNPLPCSLTGLLVDLISLQPAGLRVSIPFHGPLLQGFQHPREIVIGLPQSQWSDRREGESRLSLKYPNLRLEHTVTSACAVGYTGQPGCEIPEGWRHRSHAGVWLPQVATGLLKIFCYLA